jgi:hypothetical protein
VSRGEPTAGGLRRRTKETLPRRRRKLLGLSGLSLALMATGSITGQAFAAGAGGAGSVAPKPFAVGSDHRTTVKPADHEPGHHAAGAARAVEGNRVGEYVWYDEDGDGVQGVGEKPAPDVSASLVNTATGAVVAKTKADSNGKYLFEGFDNGVYKVCFAKPDGYGWTKQGPSERGDVSAVDPATGCTYPVEASDCENLALDAGLVPVNTLGDYVWYDLDRDGVQGPGEMGVPGVKVRLVDPATGKTIATTMTDENGKYLFTSLPDGRYRVCFKLPKTYLWTKPGAGSDVTVDSNANTKTGCSGVVTLGPGNRDDRTVDAGIVNELHITVVKSDRKTHKPLAGAVFQLWKDTNGKPGLQRSGARKDKFVGDCVTNRKGHCSLDTLRAGTYYLVEKDVPEGYVLPKHQVTGPFKLSDANGCPGDGLVVKISNKRGEPCKGKC